MKIILSTLIILSAFKFANAQSDTTKLKSTKLVSSKELKLNLNEAGSHYLKATVVNQVWTRYTENNDGTVLFDFPTPTTFDIGIRRTRVQVFGQITDRVFFYSQFGMNNFNYLSQRQAGAYFHDVLGEYKLKNSLSLGGGLTGWSGLSRYSSAGVASILMMDAPLLAQATNSATDQFLRKLSIYAKGKLEKLDYRLAISHPFAIQQASAGTGLLEPLSSKSSFSLKPNKLQYQGYFSYQFFDQESNILPYTTGSYLGKKKVLNIGTGFIYQPDAMWHKNSNGDTIETSIQLLAIDLFYDSPIEVEKGTAVTFYGGFFNYDFGPGYVRSIGAMNPAAGGKIKTGFTTFGGPGNSFPMVGSGNILFAQIGYLLRKDLFHDQGTLQPYIGTMASKFRSIKNSGATIDAGINWLMNGHGSKLTINYQSRPVFRTNSKSDIVNYGQKGSLTVQYQVAF